MYLNNEEKQFRVDCTKNIFKRTNNPPYDRQKISLANQCYWNMNSARPDGLLVAIGNWANVNLNSWKRASLCLPLVRGAIWLKWDPRSAPHFFFNCRYTRIWRNYVWGHLLMTFVSTNQIVTAIWPYGISEVTTALLAKAKCVECSE
jgi:hypothetical protein